ncbi:hypothetical protein BOTBODRAFT_32794 [Botryobasidium botryosum FD-172 SS1]|uniref:Cns1/TTC4 wheel domain-containing protein n=1 Tax=Botryobasidium botryosum (strain FD-172 SS1) TaxID=930990 RepID=A0A067MF17_BOTB1|nr:hypothetical protein BOTBODRAFT_32794 [Botryobasidium botryosum FD-172 SS1]
MASLPQPRPVTTTEDDFNSVPLFMRALPEEDTANPTIDALQSLLYEGTPDEIASNFKEQGNEYFKGKRYREALKFYTQGVDAKPEDSAVREALLCNRAACNLELQNYGSVLRDCSSVLSQNGRSSKALYRSALALKALGRLEEAVDSCERCLAFDTDNKAVRELLGRLKVARDEATKREQFKQEKIRKEREEKAILKEALRLRNLVVVPPADYPYGFPHFAKRHTGPPTPSAPMIIPAFFVYPQYHTSDLIAEFDEDTTFSSHIETMFPPENSAPEWDKEGEYTAKGLVVYIVTFSKRLLKIGGKMTLKDVYEVAGKTKDGKKDGLELKDGYVSFIVLPKGDVEKGWIADFKQERDAQ